MNNPQRSEEVLAGSWKPSDDERVGIKDGNIIACPPLDERHDGFDYRWRSLWMNAQGRSVLGQVVVEYM